MCNSLEQYLLTWVFIFNLVSSFSLSQVGNIDRAYIKEHYDVIAKSVANKTLDDLYEIMVMESTERNLIRDQVMLKSNNIFIEKFVKLKESESNVDLIIDDIFNIDKQVNNNLLDDVNIDLIINDIYSDNEDNDFKSRQSETSNEENDTVSVTYDLKIKEEIDVSLMKKEEEIFLADQYAKDFQLEDDHIVSLTTDQTVIKASDSIDTNDKTGEIIDNGPVDNTGDIHDNGDTVENNSENMNDQTGKINKIVKEISENGREINQPDRTLNFITGKMFIDSSLKESSGDRNEDVQIVRVYIFHGVALLIFLGFLVIFGKTVIGYKYSILCYSGGRT